MTDTQDFFAGHDSAYEIHRAVERAVNKLGPCSVRVSKSQVSFRRKHPFAATWLPGRYLKGQVAPLVLTVYLRRRDGSRRWKEIVEAKPGCFTHHAELWSEKDLDQDLRSALSEAWRTAV